MSLDNRVTDWRWVHTKNAIFCLVGPWPWAIPISMLGTEVWRYWCGLLCRLAMPVKASRVLTGATRQLCVTHSTWSHCLGSVSKVVLALWHTLHHHRLLLPLITDQCLQAYRTNLWRYELTSLNPACRARWIRIPVQDLPASRRQKLQLQMSRHGGHIHSYS